MPVERIRDLDVFYESRGEGEPVLLIHGLGSSTEDWEPQVAALARRYRVLTYDVRGHGRTAKPKGRYSMKQFADDAAAFLDHLGLHSAHVVGISMGGMIALQLATDHPQLLRSLCIVNSGPELVLKTWRQKIAIYQRFAIVRLMGMRKMGEVLAKVLFVRAEHERERRTFVERWSRNDPRAYLRSLRALIGWTVSARLGSIRCPTLVIAADSDYTPVAFKEEYTKRIPGAQLVVIPESRHMLPVERPEEFNTALLRFLSGVSTGVAQLPKPRGDGVRA